jgi:hypothetical protein
MQTPYRIQNTPPDKQTGVLNSIQNTAKNQHQANRELDHSAYIEFVKGQLDHNAYIELQKKRSKKVKCNLLKMRLRKWKKTSSQAIGFQGCKSS